VTTLARYFRWDEHYILWELPLVRGWAYIHALYVMNNIPTMLLSDAVNEEQEFDGL
jgi:hypothetical protein